MSERPRVLYICHSHPAVRPGGAEAYALELCHGIRENGAYEPIFLAKGGPPFSKAKPPHPGSLFGLVDSDPNQYFFFTEGYDFDWVFGTMSGKEFYTRHFHEFLRAYRPDVVHFQHTLFLGYDMIRQVKNSLPGVPIVYTLHEFLPICHRQGQMVRTVNGEERCERETPARCHECFPDISPQTFFQRKQFIQAQFALVDLFLAPCHFLRQRFIDWGIPADRIRYEEYGRQPITPPPEVTEERPRNRFGYFGQLTRFKGAHVLLEAMKLLAGESQEPQLRLHGANLDLQSGTYQNEIRALLEATKSNVTMVGRYEHADLPRLMSEIDWVVVPSLWWENSPLVIQEAFAYKKPVLCSNIGGMAEKVADEVTGLHFRAGDAADLAATIRKAAASQGLWENLRENIRPPYAMAEHVESVVNVYRELTERRAAAR